MRRALQGLAGLLLFVLGALVVLGQFGRVAMHAYRISTSAMEPTLHCARPAVGCEADTNDRVLVPRFLPGWSPSRGDIIVFEASPEARAKCGAGGAFVKRLIGLPGETISARNGNLSIDGRPFEEPYVERDRRDNETGSWRVPQGEYFLLGDARANSCDSRHFGSVPRDNLVGPVVALYWPFNRIGSP